MNRGQHLSEEITIAPSTGEFSSSEGVSHPSIQPLPTEVVYHIAAGEVIDSLAAAVRELIENALDAQASHVALSLWPDQGQIRVADNGSGMTLGDLGQAATPHSTSKIRAQQDLNEIHSLGFRGEALHSLARLGRLEICSRPQTAQQGWRAAYSTQGQMMECLPSAMAPGDYCDGAKPVWPMVHPSSSSAFSFSTAEAGATGGLPQRPLSSPGHLDPGTQR